MVRIDHDSLPNEQGRKLMLRGVNLEAAAKYRVYRTDRPIRRRIFSIIVQSPLLADLFHLLKLTNTTEDCVIGDSIPSVFCLPGKRWNMLDRVFMMRNTWSICTPL